MYTEYFIWISVYYSRFLFLEAFYTFLNMLLYTSNVLCLSYKKFKGKPIS